MSELSELREIKINQERGEEFFTELEDLLTQHLELGTPIESVTFYLTLSLQLLMTEAAAELFEDE